MIEEATAEFERIISIDRRKESGREHSTTAS